jgi:putrescine transport system ATP-binding protein
MTDSSFVVAAGIAKRYRSERVLAGCDVRVDAHQTLAVLGRSGSGKTTLLKILAGLEPADAGTLRVGGRLLDGLPPQRRGIVYLSQEPLLFPHLSVLENVAFAARIRGERGALEQARALLDDLAIGAHALKRPDQLSGGQQQRVAFGRATMARPDLLLLDEPFGKLDVETRAQMQDLYARIAYEQGLTALFVTHDLKEALRVGDAFGLMRAGRLHIYDSRAAFVADPATGVRDELRFWEEIADRSAEPAPLASRPTDAAR